VGLNCTRRLTPYDRGMNFFKTYLYVRMDQTSLLKACQISFKIMYIKEFVVNSVVVSPPDFFRDISLQRPGTGFAPSTLVLFDPTR